MMSEYLIKLKPLCPYFIGGENTFGEGKKANYFAKSLLMPQQSTVLGVIRYKILKIYNLLGFKTEEKEKVSELIGLESFSLEKALDKEKDHSTDQNEEQKEKKSPFGVIERVSSLFIMDEKAEDDTARFYTAMPLDNGIAVTFEEDVNCLWSDKTTKKLVLLDEHFNPKTYDNYRYFVNPNGEKLDDVLRKRYDNDKKSHPFIGSEQIGITKTSGEGSDRDAFYKQEVITMHPDLCFACMLEMKEDIPEDHYNDMVFMGANRSMFKMTIEKIEGENDLDFISSDSANYFWPLAKDNRLLLLSDSYLEDGVLSKADFIWGESVTMRTIKSKVEDGVKWNKPDKTNLYHLQSKGSVLYGDESISELLEIGELRRIGMNIFLQPKNITEKKN